MVKEMDEGLEGLYKLVTSVPLNTGLMDTVNTTLTIQVVSAADSDRTSTNVLRRESTLQPPLEHWYSWPNLFKLRRMRSVESTAIDDFSVDDYAVFMEQSANKGEPCTARCYQLFSSANLEEAKAACESLKRTLKHFAAAKIPEDLLISLVLPQPKTLVEIPKVVFEYLKSRNHADISFIVDLHINNSPLTHHACTSDEPHVLKLLLNRGADIFYEERYTGNSLLHTAAKYSHSSLVVLLDVLKQRFSDERYHQCINKLNHYHLDSNRLKNPEGMHIMSFALGEMNILGLAPHRLSPEPRNRNERPGVSPLMLAVGDENIKSVGVLLASGADPNVTDPLRKTSALHIAATTGNESMMQLLLAFGASIDSKNEDNATPLDLAEKSSNSSKCVELLKTVDSLRKHAEDAWGNGRVRDSKNKNGDFLLCIDGGGTRALIPVFLLNLVEQRMKNISKTKNLQISRYFNWLSGTSAGSFIILGMVYQSLSPARILTSIIAERDKLFCGTRIYDEDSLQEFIKGVVGDTKFMDEVKEPKVIVPTTLVDRSPPESVLITNYSTDISGRRWKVHEAVQASAAVPTYFPAFERRYVDGGLMVPNPTLVTITESLTNGNESSIGTVVSLGTGTPPTVDQDMTEIVYPRFTSFLSDVKQDFKYIYHLVDMLTANISNLGHTVVQSQAWCKSMGSHFYRFSPELTSLHDLDTKDDSAMADIFYETYLSCLRNSQEIENLACELLNNGPQY